MIPHHVYYQLAVVGLLWLCVMLHYVWSSRGAVSLQPPAEPVPSKFKRKPSNEPKPFEGLTQKPQCAACEHDANHPMPPAPRRPAPCHRPTDAPVSSTPPGIFAPMQAVITEAGWGCATCAPTAIPVGAYGDSCSVRPAKVTFWRRMAPSFTASGRRWSCLSGCWRASPRA